MDCLGKQDCLVTQKNILEARTDGTGYPDMLYKPDKFSRQ